MHVRRQAPKDGVIQETAARAAEVTKEKKIMSEETMGRTFYEGGEQIGDGI